MEGVGTLAGPNHALEPTPNSLRSYVAAAIGRGSPRAFGGASRRRTIAEADTASAASPFSLLSQLRWYRS